VWPRRKTCSRPSRLAQGPHDWKKSAKFAILWGARHPLKIGGRAPQDWARAPHHWSAERRSTAQKISDCENLGTLKAEHPGPKMGLRRIGSEVRKDGSRQKNRRGQKMTVNQNEEEPRITRITRMKIGFWSSRANCKKPRNVRNVRINVRKMRGSWRLMEHGSSTDDGTDD
jgi:hypothetical protein